MPNFEDWWWEYWLKWAGNIALGDPRHAGLTSEQLRKVVEAAWNHGYRTGVDHALDTVGKESFEDPHA